MSINVNELFFFSSQHVYGNNNISPLTEDLKLAPISPYGVAKASSELILQAASQRSDLKVTIVRLSNVVGAGQKFGILPDFTRALIRDNAQLKVLGNGQQARNFIHVNDIISAIKILVAQTPQDKISIYNIASADYITISEVAKIVISVLGDSKTKCLYEGGDPRMDWRFATYNK